MRYLHYSITIPSFEKNANFILHFFGFFVQKLQKMRFFMPLLSNSTLA